MIAQPHFAKPPAQHAPVPPLRAGHNVRLGRNPLGVWLEGPSGGADFRHPFTVHTAGNSARVSHGLVLGNIVIEPWIGSKPASAPGVKLKLSPERVNERGETWVCVEVTPREDGTLDAEQKEATVEIVQRDHPIVTVGATGRAPLAMLVYRDGRAALHQVAMFHFRYETAVSAGQRKHFFF